MTQTAAAAGGKLRVFDFTFSLTQSYTFWSGLLGGTFLTMASHGTDQTMVQRLLAARNERDSKKALLVSGVIIFVQFALFLVLGVMLFVYMRNGSLAVPEGDPDRIYPGVHRARYARRACRDRAGVHICDCDVQCERFIELAGFIEHDGHGREATAQTRRNSLGRSRRMTLLWGVVLGALGLIRWGPVLVAGLTIASITYGALLGVFLLGTWNRRANENGALVGFVAGIATMIAVERLTPLAWTWYVLVGTIVTFAVGAIASEFTRREPGANDVASGFKN